MRQVTRLEQARLHYQPALPAILKNLLETTASGERATAAKGNDAELKAIFPNLFAQPLVAIEQERGLQHSQNALSIGVVLSGGQAPGGHNVIAGVLDALHSLHPKSRLIGFLNGPSGIVEGKWIEITPELMGHYRNLGGFDIIGSGRTKIESHEQLAGALKTVDALALDGLVVIGGDDSNTNAAVLAEYFVVNHSTTRVIGVPKTIDGDLKNDYIELSFGFDTACKVYSEMIGNLMRDALSAKKYYHFVKLMGRSASHIALECALETHPNMTILGEEVVAKKKTLVGLTQEIADMIALRAGQGKNYGVLLIPEGLIEFIPEFNALIKELNILLSPSKPHLGKIEGMKTPLEKVGYICQQLDKEAENCFLSLPDTIQQQLLLDRDPHGNVQVAHIDTEQLFIYTVKEELKVRAAAGAYTGKFDAVAHYFGYEGRSAMPSNFDCNYCYALGHVAVVLVKEELTGYMSALQGLSGPVATWKPLGVPLTTMMRLEERHGKQKPVIEKALVDLNGAPFAYFAEHRARWIQDDDYGYPGPIQFFGEPELTDGVTVTLQLESVVTV